MHDIRAANEADFERILRLNDAEVRQTSTMDVERLASLAGMAAHFTVATVDGQFAGFLIALREGAPYDNDNYRWFASRFAKFFYVDRIVVDADFAGRGIGRGLYDDLFAVARTQGVPAIACEYNLDPPNPASRAFHDKFGFKELGTQWAASGTKRVSMQAATVE
jgi:predicted GNAT superfamily acetyltransferase